MRMPLNTRLGYALAPMEPGWRTLCEPWVSGPRPKLCRLMVPWKPLPLLTPATRHVLAVLERLDGDGVADLELADAIELHEMTHAVLEAGLLEVAELGLADVLVLALLEGELHGLIAVSLDGADLGDRAGSRLDDGDGHDVAVVVEELGHAHFLADDASHGATQSLISMWTPAGRSRRISWSTVLGVG